MVFRVVEDFEERLRVVIARIPPGPEGASELPPKPRARERVRRGRRNVVAMPPGIAGRFASG